MTLLRSYLHLVLFCLSHSKVFLLVCFLIIWLMSTDWLLSIGLVLLFLLYTCFHEFGHLIFLKKYQLDYQLEVTYLLLNVSFCAASFRKLTFSQKLQIVLGGPLFGCLYGGSLLFLLESSSYLIWLVVLIILSEGMNLLFGQDGKLLEKVIKERKRTK